MARNLIDGTATIAGSATLPFVSIYSSATVNPRVREIHCYNTTATGGFVVALARLSSTGTQGAALTEQNLDGTGSTPAVTGFAGHTVGPTITHLGPSKPMGAAIGDGFIWVFNNDVGANCAIGTTNGLGLYVPSGTGQICRYTIIWDE